MDIFHRASQSQKLNGHLLSPRIFFSSVQIYFKNIGVVAYEAKYRRHFISICFYSLIIQQEIIISLFITEKKESKSQVVNIYYYYLFIDPNYVKIHTS